jgi:DNA-binding CsgD family transcriptional regulator
MALEVSHLSQREDDMAVRQDQHPYPVAAGTELWAREGCAIPVRTRRPTEFTRCRHCEPKLGASRRYSRLAALPGGVGEFLFMVRLPVQRHAPRGPAAALRSLGPERSAAIAVALAALVAGVATAAGSARPDETLARAAAPPAVLIAALLLARVPALAIAALAVALTAVVAATDAPSRGILIATACVDALLLAAGRAVLRLAARRQRAAALEASPALRHGGRLGAAVVELPPRSRPPGWTRLSARQAAVLDMVIEGATARTIAERLGISRRTVESHVAAAYGKLGVTGRPHLLAACRAGLDRGADAP